MAMDYSQLQHVYLEQQNFINNNNVTMNSPSEKKRTGDEAFHTTPMINQSSSITQLRTQALNSVLVQNSCLEQINDHLVQNGIQNNLRSLLNHHEMETDQYVTSQGEKLRHILAAKTYRDCIALIQAAKQAAAYKVLEKDMEIDKARKTTMELENQISNLERELVMWQAKALSYDTKAAFLRGQIEQVESSRVEDCRAESDAESGYVDPKRAEIERRRVCRVCGVSEVSAVMLPCRHLCMCSQCDALSALTLEIVACPVCQVYRSGSIQVLFS